jgi:Type ISP C-terminal specificity domain/N-6 DNA Methylase
MVMLTLIAALVAAILDVSTQTGRMPAMIQAFETYVEKLRKIDQRDQTEHSSRAALEGLLETFAAKGRSITIQHEPRRFEDKGSPDFRVTQKGMILGYVEVKALGANLDKVLKSDQIKKYLSFSENIIVTDYLHFILIGAKGTVKMRGSLAFESDLESRNFRIKPENAEAVAKILDQFFTAVPEGIGKSEQLAMALATRSKALRDFLGEELVRQQKEHEQGKLWGLYGELKKQVFHELTLKEFADAFAQMLAYGLFMAKLNVENDEQRQDQKIVTLANAREFIPASFQLIRELVDFLGELDKPEYVEVKWVVEEVLSIVNSLDLAAISENLSFRQRKAISRKVKAQDEEEHRLFERDPFIYFYEDYLKAFDKETRKGRGVYYTPPPIVNFIVRAVDDILKDKFEIADGLADHKRVTVLDFACGTGTFLLEVMNQIFENIGGADKRVAKDIVREHILKNIYGFEYLIAPYTIAHLKLSQYLKDKGHPLHDKERLQVYLTNTLEPIAPQKNLLLPEVTKEVEAAQKVKDKPILVIVGNPPYSAKSRNNGPWAKKSVKPYEFVEGVHFGERKHWLNDDYVKFIRFAQSKVDANGEGIVGLIANRWWLENVTFRGMRHSLFETFDQIQIIDLGGEIGDEDDENVFDITKGVAIALFTKRAGIKKGVFFSKQGGSRIAKYNFGVRESVGSIDWTELAPNAPNFFGVPKSEVGRLVYDSWHPVDAIFEIGSTGVLTARDPFAIATSGDEVLRRTFLLSDISKRTVLLEEFPVWKAGDESLAIADRHFATIGVEKEKVREIQYRPFDTQFYYDSDETIFRRRNKVMQHMNRDAIGLAVCRLVKGGDWRHCLVSSQPTDDSTVSDKSKERGYLFPLYLRTASGDLENVSSIVRTYLDARYAHHYEPEDILGYIYAILHSPSYRRRYAEFLRIDFPRIPFCDTKPQFDALSKLGWEMVQAHLLKKLPRQNLADIQGKGESKVEAVRYSPQEKAIYINADCSFAPMPEEVWNFHIGGYQVLDKYLKSRKGRTLSLDEIRHISKVADSLAFTIAQMQRIDAAYLQAFPDRG